MAGIQPGLPITLKLVNKEGQDQKAAAPAESITFSAALVRNSVEAQQFTYSDQTLTFRTKGGDVYKAQDVTRESAINKLESSEAAKVIKDALTKTLSSDTVSTTQT